MNTVNTKNIPACLLSLPHWVGWRVEVRDGKPTKSPRLADNSGYASSTDKRTWCGFAGPWADTLDGIGFAFSDTEYAGVDLDNCIDADGKLHPSVQRIVDMLPAYWEVSPSGKGIKGFVRGKLPGPGRQAHPVPWGGKIEFYDSGRYFTVTGKVMVADDLSINRDFELTALYRAFVADKPTAHRLATPSVVIDDDAKLLDCAKRAANGAKFTRLYGGDTADHGGDESRADLALVGMLAFWTGADAGRIDRLFRTSGLYREKWDSKRASSTYGGITIDKALATARDFYRADYKANGKAAKVGSRPDPEIFRLADLVDTDIPEPKWVIEGILPEGLSILAGKPKCGKAQPLDAPVLTPTGYRPMGSLVVGNMVVGADGRPTCVLAVHPQGTRPVFVVRFSDGSSVETTADHLWLVQTHNDRTSGKRGRVKTTEDMANELAGGKQRTLYIPLCRTIHLSPLGPLPLDPYLLGVLLGDGGLTKNVVLSFGDADILDIIAPLLPSGVQAVVAPDGTAAGLTTPRGKPNPLLESIRSLGLLGLKSPEKFIPDAYLMASPSERFSVLQGLLDTDGGVDSGRVSYCSTSRRLADGFAWLVESLGGTAKTKNRQTYYPYKGKRKAGKPSQVVSVRLPSSFGCPFRLPRKCAAWAAIQPRKNTPPVRRVVSVSAGGLKPCQCITVAAVDGLYLTDHCIVTHNSWMMLGAAFGIASGGHALGTYKTFQGDVLYLALEDNKRRLKSRAQKVGADGIPRNVECCLTWPTLDEGGDRKMREWVGLHPAARLIIVDTLQKIRGPVPKGANAYEHDYKAVASLKAVADEFGIGVLLVHHVRKGQAEDAVESISGTYGLAGAADSCWVLVRKRGANDAVLTVTGRDVEEAELACRFDPATCRWRVEGSAEEVGLGAIRQEILDVLRETGSPLRPSEIIPMIAGTPNNVYVTLRRMLGDRQVAFRGGRYSRTDLITPSKKCKISKEALTDLTDLTGGKGGLRGERGMAVCPHCGQADTVTTYGGPPHLGTNICSDCGKAFFPAEPKTQEQGTNP